MGIKSINQFLKAKNVNCFIDKYPLTNFSNHRIALDAANWCYMFIAGEHRDTVFKTKNIIENKVDRSITLQKMYNKFIQFNILLMQNNITPVWCWDGIAHEEKGPEREKRKKARSDKQTRINELHKKIEAVPTWLRNARNLGDVPPEMRVMALEYHEMETELKKLMATQVLVSFEEMNIIRGIAEGLGIPSVQAEHEGEMLCSQLAIKGKVSGVWSSDTDNYAMGTPVIITGFDGFSAGGSLVKIVSIPHILYALDLNQEQFREFCIMCGCDYNTNIKNYGPNKAYDLIKKYGNIDNILKETGIDATCLNYEICKDYLTPKNIDIDSENLNVNLNKFYTNGKEVLSNFGLESNYKDLKLSIEKIAVKPTISFE